MAWGVGLPAAVRRPSLHKAAGSPVRVPGVTSSRKLFRYEIGKSGSAGKPRASLGLLQLKAPASALLGFRAMEKSSTSWWKESGAQGAEEGGSGEQREQCSDLYG